MASTRLLSALLKYWRGRRGLSQLDLALEAGVSARHVSFLESARARPSEAMLLRLLTTMNVPLREQNEALRAAGLAAKFEEPPFSALSPEIERAIAQMMRQHEPFPLSVLALDGEVLRVNTAAERVFAKFAAEPAALRDAKDVYSLFFDPRLLRESVTNWDEVGCSLVSRLHREALLRSDARLHERLEQVLRFPDVPADWRYPDFAHDEGPTLTVRHARGKLRANFLVTITTFSAPRLVTLEEVRLESCFPLDDATDRWCRSLAALSPASTRRAARGWK
jgi:transcriptional regulator with XRE-family HTH domain